jgi:hypothetical protein
MHAILFVLPIFQEAFVDDIIINVPTRRLVPTRCPVLLLARVAAVAGGLALRAHLEVLSMADNLAQGTDTRPLLDVSGQPEPFLSLTPPSVSRVMSFNTENGSRCGGVKKRDEMTSGDAAKGGNLTVLIWKRQHR